MHLAYYIYFQMQGQELDQELDQELALAQQGGCKK